ncbi:MAG: ATP-grasp domain-containing protein [Pseudomonadota bacterium]
MSGRNSAIVYVDIDRSAVELYNYRTPHFEVAASLGWACVTVAEDGHPRAEAISRSSDAFVSVPRLSAAALADVIRTLRETYEVKVLFSYPGQSLAGLNISQVVEDACDAVGLFSPPAAAIDLCNNKYAMRLALQRAGLPNVQAVIAQNESDLAEAARQIGFPLIMKPVFGSGSALIKKCRDLDELRAHYQLFNRMYSRVAGASDFGGGALTFEAHDGASMSYVPGRTVMLETYLEGIEATIECVVVDGDPIPLLLHEKLLVSFEESTVLEHLLVVPSASFTPEQIETAKDYCRDCVAALGLKRSFVHFEFRMTPEGPRVIEINPRLGGFYVHQSLKDVAGIDPFLTNLAMLSGEEGGILDNRLRQAAAAATDRCHTMFVVYPPSPGRIKSIHGEIRAAQRPGIRAFDITSYRGRIECDTEENFIAKFWAAVPSAEAARQLYDDVRSDLRIEMEGVEGR